MIWATPDKTDHSSKVLPRALVLVVRLVRFSNLLRPRAAEIRSFHVSDRRNRLAGALESGTERSQADGSGTNDRHSRPAWRPVFMHFVELQIPMGAGALLCLLAGQLVGSSSRYAAVYHPGSALFALGDIVFLTAPVFAWMIWRGRTRQLCLGLSTAMITPVALVVVAGEIMGTDYLHWLVTGMYPVMAAGIAIFMLYRRNEFETHWAKSPE